MIAIVQKQTVLNYVLFFSYMTDSAPMGATLWSSIRRAKMADPRGVVSKNPWDGDHDDSEI